MVALLVIVTILLFLTFDYFVQRAEAGRAAALAVREAVAEGQPVAAVPAASPAQPLDLLPAGVFVGPGHCWAQLEPAGSMRLGADALALNAIGELDEVLLPAAGASVRRGDPVAILRKGERALTLRAPMDGTVAAVNDPLLEDPSPLRRDPFGQGWLLRLVPRHLSAALRGLHVAEEARAWMRQELRRLRDFLAERPQGLEPALAGATLPDGGLPVQAVAEQLDEAAWALLQATFFTPDAQ